MKVDLIGEKFGQFVWLCILLGKRNGYIFDYIRWQIGLDGWGIGRNISLKINDNPVCGRQSRRIPVNSSSPCST